MFNYCLSRDTPRKYRLFLKEQQYYSRFHSGKRIKFNYSMDGCYKFRNYKQKISRQNREYTHKRYRQRSSSPRLRNPSPPVYPYIKRKQKKKCEERSKRTKKHQNEKKPVKDGKNVKNQSSSKIKPFAIIDLGCSPFKELTPSPKNVIVVTDRENNENGTLTLKNSGDSHRKDDTSRALKAKKDICDLSLLVLPGTLLNSKQTQSVVNTNEPEDMEWDDFDPREELQQRLNHAVDNSFSGLPLYRNPSPGTLEMYDPLKPTNSRSPSPKLFRDCNKNTNSRQLKADVQSTDLKGSVGISEKFLNSQVAELLQCIFPSKTCKPSTNTENQPIPSFVTSSANPIIATRPNILNSMILQAATPQRTVFPSNVSTKLPIISIPIKPMPIKKIPDESGFTVANQKIYDFNRRPNIDKILDLESAYSPLSNDYQNLFGPPPDLPKVKSKYKPTCAKVNKDDLRILDDVPNSAVELHIKEKILTKLNRQERVIEEVKLVLKPHYNMKHINKEEYKDILRCTVPNICHNKLGEINPKKIRDIVEKRVNNIRYRKKRYF